MNKPVNLHTISALEEISVREGVKLRPLRSSDAKRLLEILADDSSIRNRVTVVSRFHTPEDVVKEVQC